MVVVLRVIVSSISLLLCNNHVYGLLTTTETLRKLNYGFCDITVHYQNWIKKQVIQYFQHLYPGPEVQARFQSHCNSSYSDHELTTATSGSRTEQN